MFIKMYNLHISLACGSMCLCVQHYAVLHCSGVRPLCILAVSNVVAATDGHTASLGMTLKIDVRPCISLARQRVAIGRVVAEGRGDTS